MGRTGKRLRVALLTTLVSLTAMAAVATPASADRTIVVVMKPTDAGQPASARTLTFTIGDRDATDPGAVAARFGLQADQIASVSVLAPPTQPASPPITIQPMMPMMRLLPGYARWHTRCCRPAGSETPGEPA